MKTIKNIYLCEQNILIVDSENKLWIVGENSHRKTGFGEKDKSLYSPIYTGITLDNDEVVNKFYVYKHLLSIYTSEGKLFISRNLCKNSKHTNNKKIENIRGDNSSSNANVITTMREIVEVENQILNETMHNESHSVINRPTAENIYGINIPSIGVMYFTPVESVMISNEKDLSEEDTESTGCDDAEVSVDDDTHWEETGENDNDNDTEYQTEESENSMTDQDEYSDVYQIDNNDSFFDNLEYFSDLVYMDYPKIPTSEGIDLLEDNVEDVVYVTETIFFRKNKKLYLYKKNINPVKFLLQKNFGLTTVMIQKEKYQYYELILPFDSEKMFFRDNFVYIKSASYHHIISTFILNVTQERDLLIWLYFKTDYEINENDIYFVPIEGTVYVKKENCAYKYCHAIHDLKQFVDNAKIFIVPSNDNISRILYCIRDDGLYFDHGYLKKEIDYNDLLLYMVDMNTYNNSKFIMIDINEPKSHIVKGNTLFFNIHGFVHYKLLDTGLIYYHNEKLYYCTNIALPENKYGTSEIEKIKTSNDSYYMYIFNNVPYPIVDIQFTNNLVIIETDNKYYYHTIDTEKFYVDRFTEITVHDNLNEIQLVSKHYVVRNRKEFENTVTLAVSIDSNKFIKLLNIIEMLRNNNNFNINFMKGTSIVSYGDGPKREFMEAAVIDFSEHFLIKYNVCCEFNLEKMEQFVDDDLINIGSMLHAVICHSNNHLPIRLPLTLVTAILKKEPSISELEYFARLENPEAFNNVYKFKKSPEQIKEFGYDTYEDCLKFFCKYYYHDEKINSIIQHISSEIAKGFKDYNEIKNLSIMNSPTLDYFLSGDYCLDRELLIKNLNIVDNSSNKNIPYNEIINDIIRNLPEEKLMILLRNWSGTSIVKKSSSYVIIINKNNEKIDEYSNPDINFATCNVELIISENLINSLDTKNLLIDLLTTPFNTMRDPY